MKAEAPAGAPSGMYERKYVDLVLDEVEPNGGFCGYASLFGTVDLGKDVVERGAFANSLRRRRAAGIRMLFQHDPAQPIGMWTRIEEDARGLFVQGRLTREVARAREVLALMRAGALDGLSIGFRAVRTRRDAVSGVRRILEADLWEISIVTFPMQPGARVETVKARPDPFGASLFRQWQLAALVRKATRLINPKGKCA
jgi:HK97 family phage prohead protease